MSAPENLESQRLWIPPTGMGVTEVPLHPNGAIPGTEGTDAFPFIGDDPDIAQVGQPHTGASDSGRHALVEQAAGAAVSGAPVNHRGWGADAATSQEANTWFANLENWNSDDQFEDEPEAPAAVVPAHPEIAPDETLTTFTTEHAAAVRALEAADTALNPPSNPTRPTEVLRRTDLWEYAAARAANSNQQPAVAGGEFSAEPAAGTQAETVAPAPQLPHVGALGSMVLAAEALETSGYNGIVITNPDVKIPMPADERDARIASFNDRVMPPARIPDVKDLYYYGGVPA